MIYNMGCYLIFVRHTPSPSPPRRCSRLAAVVSFPLRPASTRYKIYEKQDRERSSNARTHAARIIRHVTRAALLELLEQRGHPGNPEALVHAEAVAELRDCD